MPGQRCSQAGTRDATTTSGTDSGEGVLRSPRMSPRRCTLAALALLPACVPEPANAVEIRTAVAELVDQTRAMAIEHALVDLTTNLDPSPSPAKLAAAVGGSVAARVSCAAVETTADSVLIDFGADGCGIDDRDFAGELRVIFSEPTPGARLATLSFVDLGSGGSTLTGTMQVTWGVDETRRVISEVRLDTPDMRQVEIQSDRIQRTHDGALQIDGWHRWQTLMGRWKMELRAWEQPSDRPVPDRGIADIATPYEHDIILDFTGPRAEGQELRANGGRRDHVFAIAGDGEVIDLGDD